jgi:molybdate transport system regulatory protein
VRRKAAPRGSLAAISFWFGQRLPNGRRAVYNTVMDARVKLWVEIDGQIVLSGWRVSLLEAIERTGSLTRAAEALNVPYRTAWHKLKQMEQRLGLRLVTSHSGGAEGGSTRLTPAAHCLIACFGRFSAGLTQEVDQRFREAFADLPLPAPAAARSPQEAPHEHQPV